jgi:hypothetical protein
MLNNTGPDVVAVEFLSSILPESGNYICAWGAIDSYLSRTSGRMKLGPFQHDHCSSIEELAAAMRRNDVFGRQVYHALATFKQPKIRQQPNVALLRALWLEIDAGDGKPYPDWLAAQEAVLAFCDALNLPTPMFVRSGNGIHAYWPLKVATDLATWQRYADGLKQACARQGLKADPARTADAASVLRTPGTHNRKAETLGNGPPAKVECLGLVEAFELAAFDVLLQPQPGPKSEPASDRTDDTKGNRAELLAHHCAQLAFLRDTQGNVSEPFWYAALGVLACCEDGREFAHQWSSGYPGYSEHETNKKFEQARAKSGPTTCARFHDTFATEPCEGCPQWGKIKSPIETAWWPKGAADGGPQPNGNTTAPPTKTIELVWASDVVMRSINWLWFNRIPRGTLTANTGLPGEGKSQQLTDIVARVSAGGQWPDGTPIGEAAYSILLTAEDMTASVVAPRLVAAGAALERIAILSCIRFDRAKKRSFLLTEDLEELGQLLTTMRNKGQHVALIGIDPVTAYMGVGKIDSHKTTDVRGVLGPLVDMSEELDVASYVVTHPPKSSTSAINAFIGSQAFIAAPRVGYLTIKEMKDGEPTGRTLVTMVKTNVGPKMPALAYRMEQRIVGNDPKTSQPIVASNVVWERDPVEITADQAIAATNAKGREEISAKDAAAEFLRRKLKDGPVLVTDIMEHAEAELIAEKTLRRAKDELGVVSEKRGMVGPWQWKMPEGGQRS